MPIYELTSDTIRPLDETTFKDANLHERSDLQRLLREHVEVISPDTLVISEEFGEWEDANRRIDLLGVDKQGNIVVIELKRTETGGHMELQAIRYAAMVSTLTFERAAEIYKRHLEKNGGEGDAEEKLREFLDWEEGEEPIEDCFAQDVRIVLASAEFGKELTTTVLWLNERSLDIRCVRLRPYVDGERVLLDVQRVIPLPEADQYQVRLREKAQRERESRKSSRDYTKFDVIVDGEVHATLSKGRAVWVLVKSLHEKGVTPKRIAEQVTFRKKNAFWSVAGEIHDEAEFVASITKEREAEGGRFDEWRWFRAADELIHAEGRTYCVSRQWGGRASKWMQQVLSAFPDRGVEVRQSAK